MWQRLRPWLFPVGCVGCGRGDIALCAACEPGPTERIKESVGNVALTAAGTYDGVLRRAIVAMKGGERAYLDPLAGVLAELIGPDVPLVPLPTSRGRRAARGFDQATELARRAALRRGCDWYSVLEKRGSAQHGLNRHARLETRGRFRVSAGAVVPELAIVLDDVCTTGATLTDAISTLRAAGVAVLGAVVLARTAPGRNSRGPAVVLSDGRLAARPQTRRADEVRPLVRGVRTRMKAIWNGTVIAESDVTEVVEGNHYFPASSIKCEFFRESATHSTCPWKGVASYYTLEVAGKSNPDAAWYYPTPKDAAKNIAGHVAFWKGVEVNQ